MGAYILTYGLLGVVSAVMTGIGVALNKKFEGDPPAWLGIVWPIAIIGLFGPLVIGVTMSVSTGFDAIFNFCLALAFAVPPIIAMREIVLDAVANYVVGAAFDSSLVTPRPSDFSRARTRAVNGDITGALVEYRKYFDENPKLPAPLFAAAWMLEQNQRLDQAVEYYREIMKRFERHKHIWVQAAFRLAELYEYKLGKVDKADAVLREVYETSRIAEYRTRATKWMMDREARTKISDTA